MEPDLAGLEADLQAIYEEGGVEGFQAALVTSGGVLWSRAYGYAAEGEDLRPMTMQTAMRWGSISKTVTAMICARLIERGFLFWDQELSAVAPEFCGDNPWGEQHPVRLIHLIEHTAGWDDVPYSDFLNAQDPISLAAYAARCGPDRKSRWAPGEFFRYANAGPAVLGAVAEKVTGLPFAELARRELFTPLEMPSATFNMREVPANTLSSSYEAASGRLLTPWQLAFPPSGGLIASGEDMAKLLALVLRRGEGITGDRILEESSLRTLETMESSLAARHGVTRGYAKGIFHFQCAGSLWFGHWGRIDGFLSVMGYKPCSKFGFLLSMNTNDSAVRNRIMERLAKALQPGEVVQIPEAQGHGVARDRMHFELLSPEREMTRLIQYFTHLGTLNETPGSLVWSNVFPLGESVFYSRINERLFELEVAPGPSAALVTEGRRLFLPGAAYGGISAWNAWSRILFLILSILWIFLAAAFLVWRAFRYLILREPSDFRILLPLSILLVSFLLWLLQVFLVIRNYLFAMADADQELFFSPDGLGRRSIEALSISWAVLLLLALIVLAWRWPVVWKKHRVAAVFLTLGSGLLAAWAALAWRFGWLPFAFS